MWLAFLKQHHSLIIKQDMYKHLGWQKKISTLGPPQQLHHYPLLAAASALLGAPSVSVPLPSLGHLKRFSKDLVL